MAKSKLYAVKKKTGEDDKKPDTSKRMVAVGRVTPKKPKTTVSALRKAMDVKKPAPKNVQGEKRNISFAGDPIKKRVVKKDPVKKKLATSKYKTAKIKYADKSGKEHWTLAAMRRANTKLRGKTLVGDHNPRTDREQD